MNFQETLSKLSLFKAFRKIDIQNLLKLSKKVDSVIIISRNKSNLTLCAISLVDKVEVTALKSIFLASDKEDEAISESIAGFIKDNDIQHNNVFLIPKLDSLLIKRLQLPVVPEEEIIEAIKWEMKEDLSFDIKEAILDYKVINREVKSGEANFLDLICVLAREKEITDQVLLLRRLGLKCLGVMPLPLIYPKFINKYANTDNFPCSILHLDADKCYIAISNGKNLEFYRDLPLSTDKLKECLSGVLGSDSGEISLTSEEAERILFNVGIPQEEATYENKIGSTQILAMLRPVLERLIQELKRSLNYYHTELKGKGEKVKQLFLGGQAKKIPNLDIILDQDLDLEVKKIDLSNKIKVSSEVNRNSLLENVEILGATLNYKKDINFLPHEFSTEGIEKVQKVSLRWTTFIVSLLLIVSYLFTKVEIVSYRKRLDNALLHLEVISQVKEMKVDRDALNSFVQDLRSKEPPVGTMLKVLSSISDREVYLNEFNLVSGSKKGFISGFVKSAKNNPDAILANFVDRMNKTEYLRNIEILSVKKRKESPFDITEFNLSFQVP